MNNQNDLNKFSSFLDAATKSLSCDKTCQQNKKAKNLKHDLLTAESDLILSEPQYQLAKKNYYTYVVGESGYDEIIEQELNLKADLIVRQFKEMYSSEINKIHTELDTYNGILINFRNIVDLYENYKKENIRLFKQLKEDSNDVLTNDRKTYYEDQVIDDLIFFYYYIFLVIYVITVIMFASFSLLYSSQTSLAKRIALIVLFVLLPFISTPILGKFIQLIYWLFGLLPKNVYK